MKVELITADRGDRTASRGTYVARITWQRRWWRRERVIMAFSAEGVCWYREDGRRVRDRIEERLRDEVNRAEAMQAVREIQKRASVPHLRRVK